MWRYFWYISGKGLKGSPCASYPLSHLYFCHFYQYGSFTMLLVLLSFWHSGTCGLIDLQLPGALCLVETWRTLGAAPYHTRTWTKEKILTRKTSSLLWGVRSSLLIVHPRVLGGGPALRSGKEMAFPLKKKLVYIYSFLPRSASSPIWLPSSTLDPHPQVKESPVPEKIHTRRGCWRPSNPLV